MSATVVVTTLYRHDDLEGCLGAIALMSVKPERVLVVAREEDTESHSVARRLGADLATVHVPGLAAAIDVALQNVDTEIVAFVDDDARPHSDWLRRIVETFDGEPSAGFLGGRDNVGGDHRSGSVSLKVGQLELGKLYGNHHLGKGPARSTLHVKGANMAYRTQAVKGLPLARLVSGSGAQHGNELFLCFSAIRRGYSGIYDPAVQVDHYPAARQMSDDRLDFNPARITHDVENSAASIYLFVGPRQGIQYLSRAVLVGDRYRPGLAWALIHALRRQKPWAGFSAVLRAAIHNRGHVNELRAALKATGWASK